MMEKKESAIFISLLHYYRDVSIKKSVRFCSRKLRRPPVTDSRCGGCMVFLMQRTNEMLYSAHEVLSVIGPPRQAEYRGLFDIPLTD